MALPFCCREEIMLAMKRPVNVATLALCLYAVAYAVAAGATTNKLFEMVSNQALTLTVCGWILADARERRRKVFYDFDSWLFFCWPVAAPIYLFQTRGLWGLVPMFVFLLIMAAAMGGAVLLGS